MKTLTRILSITLVTVSLASGVITNRVKEKECFVIQMQTSSTNFDTILAECITNLANQSLAKGTAMVVLHYGDTQVIARFRIQDIQRLTANQVTFDQFVRSYILFS
jgi:arabinogalactan endo-1,4-beta-galactosidase